MPVCGELINQEPAQLAADSPCTAQEFDPLRFGRFSSETPATMTWASFADKSVNSCPSNPEDCSVSKRQTSIKLDSKSAPFLAEFALFL